MYILHIQERVTWKLLGLIQLEILMYTLCNSRNTDHFQVDDSVQRTQDYSPASPLFLQVKRGHYGVQRTELLPGDRDNLAIQTRGGPEKHEVTGWVLVSTKS